MKNVLIKISGWICLACAGLVAILFSYIWFASGKLEPFLTYRWIITIAGFLAITIVLSIYKFTNKLNPPSP